MTPQGYPLWAVDQDGSAFLVVGWDEYGFPELVTLGGPTQSTESQRVTAGYSFTTTDPTERPDINAVYAAGEDLRDRMARLADRLWGQIDADARWAAGQIRQELAK